MHENNKWLSLFFLPGLVFFYVNLVFSFLPFNMVLECGDETLAAIGKNQIVQDNLISAPVLLQPQLPPEPQPLEMSIFPLWSLPLLSKLLLMDIFGPCLSVQF